MPSRSVAGELRQELVQCSVQLVYVRLRGVDRVGDLAVPHGALRLGVERVERDLALVIHVGVVVAVMVPCIDIDLLTLSEG